ncbi:MAG TPA: ArsA-related P-loop ATPase [Anaeromyxobacter sp.]|nr:ArsA-related P-loop ATPase [Anaeromyxobacter sp.]
MSALGQSLAGRRVAVCVGAGGVGKTSLAAALALARALAGGKALVCTIDPARRLANALGLTALGNAESRVPAARLAQAGLAPPGQLFAMMLDVKRTWDDLIVRHAPDPARRDRILRNRLYQQMSAALAGSQEYMAMEKLHELAEDRDYDLIVLDTPPTAHALDFLDAPTRILDFLGSDAARVLLAPAVGVGRLGLRLAQLSGGYAARALARFTGQQALSDLGEFLQSFQGMYDGFKARAAAVRALLARPEAGFVLVTSSSPAAVAETLAFHGRLRAEAMPLAGLVVNRLTPDLWPYPSPLPGAAELLPPLAQAATSGGGPGTSRAALAERLAAALAEHQALVWAERSALAPLLEEVRVPCAMVPRLEGEVHDLAGLATLAAAL